MCAVLRCPMLCLDKRQRKGGRALLLPSEHTPATAPAAVVLYSLARFCHSPPASTNLAAAVLCYAHPAESTAALSTARPVS